MDGKIKKTLKKADRFYDREKFAEAIKHYDAALKMDPDSIHAIVSRNLACMRIEKNDDIIQRFLERNNLNPPALYMLAGQMFAKARQYEKAFDALNVITSVHPDHYLAYYNMGVVLVESYSENPKKELLEEAVRYYDKSLKIKPDFANPAINRILLLYDLKRHAEAARHCDEMLKMDPDNTHILEQKGSNLNMMGEYEKAIRCYDEALKIEPNVPSIMYLKSMSLYNMGRTKKALELLDEAVRIKPDLLDHKYFRKVLTDQLDFEDKSRA